MSQPAPSHEVSTTRRLRLDRKHTLSGDLTLDWFFKCKRWVRRAPQLDGQKSIVDAAFAVRALPAAEPAIRILILAPKRNYRRAHDRNRLKRWLREAVRYSDGWISLEAAHAVNQMQLCIMLRISAPMAAVSWDRVLEGVQEVEQALERQKPAILKN